MIFVHWEINVFVLNGVRDKKGSAICCHIGLAEQYVAVISIATPYSEGL
jgi:hypothetical protein